MESIPPITVRLARSSLHRISWHDLDAFDRHSFGWLAPFAAVTRGHFGVADLSQDIVPFYDFPECCVLMIEPAHIRKADEKLAAGRIGIARACHGKNTALMAAIVKFRFDFVARIAGSVATLFCRIFGQRIAPLDHETFDNPVKRSAIVKSRP